MPERTTFHIDRRDALIALGCAVASAVLVLVASVSLRELDGVTLGAGGVEIAIAVVILQAAVVLARRANPVACFAIIAALQIVVFAAIPPGAGVRGLAVFVAVFTVGAMLPIRPAVLVLIAVIIGETAGVAAVAVLGPEPIMTAGGLVEYALSTVLNYLALLLLGAFVTARQQTADLSAARALAIAREQRDRADRAVSDERSRMARELHDVAAHHLSGMVVQASAVERLIDHDPEAAKTATRALRSQGKETLTNLRTAVGMLRERARGDDSGGLADRGGPVPGVELLGELVDESRSAGDRVDLVVEGVAVPLPPLADVAVYRVVQEALSNVRQHAPGAPTHVSLSWDPTALTVTVANDAPATSAPKAQRDGLGLLGMRERADLIGGELEAGPTPSGGWGVSLVLPLREGEEAR